MQYLADYPMKKHQFIDKTVPFTNIDLNDSYHLTLKPIQLTTELSEPLMLID